MRVQLEDEMVFNLLMAIWEKESRQNEWENSKTVSIYLQKGDPLYCGNYWGIKLLEHLLKIIEWILEQRSRELINIDEIQFGSSPGKGTADAVFVIKQLPEKCMEKQKNLYFTFADLEKAYGTVLRELLYWCLRKRNVPESDQANRSTL